MTLTLAAIAPTPADIAAFTRDSITIPEALINAGIISAVIAVVISILIGLRAHDRVIDRAYQTKRIRSLTV